LTIESADTTIDGTLAVVLPSLTNFEDGDLQIASKRQHIINTGFMAIDEYIVGVILYRQGTVMKATE
jgi:hypothetical protein